jgi:hypothetical protein
MSASETVVLELAEPMPEQGVYFVSRYLVFISHIVCRTT